MNPMIISNVETVWDNGIATPFDPRRSDLVEFHRSVRRRTGAKFGVATRWMHAGKIHDDSNCPAPIPDMSGLVYAERGWKRWVVIAPDSSVRLTIEVPRLSEKSKPADGDLGEPRYMEGDPLHVMYGEGGDGDRDDARFFFDMHSGMLLRYQLVGRHW